ncbi:hypothetical protein IEQ34_026155 [Dendrobium chrysotoxum]|uniref:Uncharacterized protein n=1 Tax=Dendrobium chrysotoxum TaxID=161865 RepID=A0AAV7FN37_DENCH|nr:hypothetical protein IEQ34_026155 [Dendrobium chrysotoxum]
MKSAAKCDTWCELQNPANHRVFERKLRPRPIGQGHVCLGVKRYVAPCPATRRWMGWRWLGCAQWLLVPLGTAGLRAGNHLVGCEQYGVDKCDAYDIVPCMPER